MIVKKREKINIFFYNPQKFESNFMANPQKIESNFMVNPQKFESNFKTKKPKLFLIWVFMYYSSNVRAQAPYAPASFSSLALTTLIYGASIPPYLM